MTTVTLTINGSVVTREVQPRTHLADFLREDMQLTSVHLGCEHGVCGACTVLVDGAPQRTCIDFAAAADGVSIRTIESFDDDPVMAALRRAFSVHHGLQCGYCTPGVLATAYDIVTRLPGADPARIREELAGNLCRYTGYAGMVAAIHEVAANPPSRPADAVRAEPLAFAGVKQASPAAPAAVAARAAPEADSAPYAEPTLPADAAEIALSEILDLPADKAWAVLRDVETVAACLPGATLQAFDAGAGVARGVFAVAIGPMRASFEGAAKVSFDDGERTGRIGGGGEDKSSRTRADGQLDFALNAVDGGRSQLDIALRYSVRGGLAQFSRGAVVAEAAKLLIGEFSGNLAKAAAGEAVDASATAGGIGFALKALSARIRRAFGL